MKLDLSGQSKSSKPRTKSPKINNVKKKEVESEKPIYKEIDFKRLTNFKAKLNPQDRGHTLELESDKEYQIDRLKLSDIGDMKVWVLSINTKEHPEVNNPYLAHNFIEA